MVLINKKQVDKDTLSTSYHFVCNHNATQKHNVQIGLGTLWCTFLLGFVPLFHTINVSVIVHILLLS